jgi:hypothetical protein
MALHAVVLLSMPTTKDPAIASPGEDAHASSDVFSF